MPGFDAGSIQARLELDRSAFSAGLDAARGEAEEFESGDYRARLAADREQLDADLQDARTELDAFGEEHATAHLDASDEMAREKIDTLRARIDELNTEAAIAKIDVDDSAAKRKIVEIQAALDAVGNESLSPRIGADRLEAMNQELDGLKARLEEVGAQSDTTGTKMSNFADAGTTGLSSMATAALVLGPALVPIAAVATSAVATIGGALLAAGAGLGAFALATKPLYTDVSNIAAAQQNLNKAINAYGPTSSQAKTATEQLHGAMAGMPPAVLAVTAALDTAKASYISWANNLLPTIAPVVSGFLALVPAALNAITPLVTSTAGALTGIIGRLSAALSSPALHQFMSFLAGQASQALQSFASLFAGLGRGLAGMMEHAAPILSGFYGLLDRLGQKLSGLGGSAGFAAFISYVEKEGPAVGRALVAIGQALLEIVKAAAPIGAALLPAITGLARAIADIGRSHSGLLTAGIAFAGIAAVTAKLASPVIGLARGFQQLLIFLPGVTAEMVGFDAAADANPIGAIVLAVAALGVGLYELITHFRTVSDFLSGPWGTAISAAVTVIAPMIGIPMLIMGHWQAIVGFFETVWSGLKTGAGAVAAFFTGPFVGFFTAVPGRVADALKALPGLLLDALKAAGNEMLQGFEWGVALVIASAIKTPQLINQAFADLPGLLSRAARDAWSIFLAVSETVSRDIWNFVASIPGRIGSLLAPLPGLLAHAGSSMIDGLVNAIETTAQTLWGWLQGVPGHIVSFFSDAGKWLFEAGKAIIEGLINGIKSMAGGLGGAISNVIGGIVGKVKSLLGINSPSQVMIEIGTNIGEGLALGIQSTAGKVVAAFTGAGVASIKGVPLTSPSLGELSLSTPMPTASATQPSVNFSPAYHVTVQGDATQKTVKLIQSALTEHVEQLVQLIDANGGLRR